MTPLFTIFGSIFTHLACLAALTSSARLLWLNYVNPFIICIAYCLSLSLSNECDCLLCCFPPGCVRARERWNVSVKLYALSLANCNIAFVLLVLFFVSPSTMLCLVNLSFSGKNRSIWISKDCSSLSLSLSDSLPTPRKSLSPSPRDRVTVLQARKSSSQQWLCVVHCLVS